MELLADTRTGDFSFAHSLLKHHARRFRTLTATTVESNDELWRKYPQAEGYIADLLAANGSFEQRRNIGDEVEYAEGGTATTRPTLAADAANGKAESEGEGDTNAPDLDEDADMNEASDQDAEDEFEGFSPLASSSPVSHSSTHMPSHSKPSQPHPNTFADKQPKPHPPSQPPKYFIHYSVDATKLTTPSTYNALTRPLQSHASPSTSTSSTTTLPKFSPSKTNSTPSLTTPFLGFTTLLFNFPHTGGLSTDVNRQVRHNQQMLYSFLSQGKILLERGVKMGRDSRNRAGLETRARRQEYVPVSGKRGYASSAYAGGGGENRGAAVAGAGAGRARRVSAAEKGQVTVNSKSERYDTDEEADPFSEDADSASPSPTRPVPKILITLFEGEPYTLWNIRDLARSVGLECTRSWRFEWGMWPGYRHVRTLGNLEGGRGRGSVGGEGVDEGVDESEGKGEGKGDDLGGESGRGRKRGKGRGWKGEQRDARTYEFGLKNDGLFVTNGKRKRSGRDSDSEDG